MTRMSSDGHTERRPDIQALRAIAVAAVFAYHLAPTLLPGGYAGVDVFFVISGFLITGNLIREADATGTINVVRFWTRRMQRLLPAALIVLAVSAVAVIVWVPGNLQPQFLRETIAATLYGENWLLAYDSVDYLAASNPPSPVQHFWTLSAEEQFYVATPLLLLMALLFARRFGHRRGALATAIGIVTASSFLHSIALTSTDQPAAYFVTTTRAWEFGVGALLVFVRLPTSPRVALTAVALGLLGIASAARFLTAETPFPGVAAAWPVLATALLIWAGPRAGTWWRRLSGLRPVQVLGDISYSVYLWHWPLLILSAYALDRPLRLADKLILIAVTLALAAASTYLVENPIRYWRRARPPAPRIVARGAIAAMAAVLAIASSGLAAGALRQGERDRENATVLRDQASCLGARGLDTPACSGVIGTGVLIPDPERVADDGFNLPECWATVASAELHVCTFGPAGATVRLMVIGDSHSNALLPAYQVIAEQRGWQVQVAGHNGCYWTAAVQRKPTQAMVDGCEAWKRALNAWLAAEQPFDAIIVTSARRAAPVTLAPGQQLEDVTVAGLVQAWATQVARGSRIIAIRDNPDMGPDVATCVVRHRADANSACAVPAAKAVGDTDALVEAVRRTPGARLVDLTDVYCPSGSCLPVIGHVVVYSDRDHVTGTWALTLSDLLGARLAAALAP
jgi:peptidoglycan/LPS O-acetylase OafA/YrhL